MESIRNESAGGAVDAEATARGLEKIQAYLAEGEVRKVIVREPNLVNLVVS